MGRKWSFVKNYFNLYGGSKEPNTPTRNIGDEVIEGLEEVKRHYTWPSTAEERSLDGVIEEKEHDLFDNREAWSRALINARHARNEYRQSKWEVRALLSLREQLKNSHPTSSTDYGGMCAPNDYGDSDEDS